MRIRLCTLVMCFVLCAPVCKHELRDLHEARKHNAAGQLSRARLRQSAFFQQPARDSAPTTQITTATHCSHLQEVRRVAVDAGGAHRR